MSVIVLGPRTTSMRKPICATLRCSAIAILFANTIPLASQIGVRVSGVVIDQIEYKVPGAIVRLYSDEQILQGKSDAEGRFEIGNVPSGSYDLEVKAAGYRTAWRKDINVGSNGMSSIVVRMEIANTGEDCGNTLHVSYDDPKPETGGRILVIIQEYDSPPQARVEGATISAMKLGEGTIAGAGKTNKEGTVELRDLQPGEYTFRVSVPGSNETSTRSVRVARQNTTRVTIDWLKPGSMIVCQ